MSVALLTNHPAPYRQPLFAELAQRLDDLVVLYEARESSFRRWGSAVSTSYEHRFMVDAPIEEVSPARKGAATARWLHRLNPSIVISAGFGPSALAAWSWTRSHGRQLVGWSGCTSLTERRVRGARLRFRERLAQSASAWIAYGPEAQRYLLRLGADPRRVSAVGNPYGIPRVPPRARPGATVRIGFVGQLHWRKGWWIPLQAAAVAKREGVPLELSLVGDGPGSALLGRMISLHPELDIDWQTHVAPSGIGGFYANLSLLIVPSIVDQWPIVASEAIAAGVPVLCSPAEHSGVPDSVSTATPGPGPPAGGILGVADVIRMFAPGRQVDQLESRMASAQRELDPATVADRWVDLIESGRARGATRT